MLCPICGSSKLKSQEAQTQEASAPRRRTVLRCQECAILFDAEFKNDRSEVYDENYGAWGEKDDQRREAVARAKKEAFREQLRPLLERLKPRGKKLLDIGTANGYLLEVAQDLGFEVFGTEISPAALDTARRKFPGKVFGGPLADQKFESQFFDVVALTDVLEHLSDPAGEIQEIGRILKPGGWLLVISPNTDSWSHKFLGRKWFQYKYEHLFYFNRQSLERILQACHFELAVFRNNRKRFSLAYYQAYFQKYSFGPWGKIFLKIYPRLPKIIQGLSFSNPLTGEFLALARKKEKISPPQREKIIPQPKKIFTFKNIFSVLGVMLIFFIALKPPTDPDMGWHLKDGEYLLNNNFTVAKADIFSHTMPDFPLIMHEWATDAAMFWIYSHWGLFALSIFFALITTAGFLAASWGVKSGWVFKIAGAILGAIASIPVLGVRPQMLNLLGLGLVIFVIFRFRANVRSRAIYFLPLILWLWVNLHGGFAVGLFFIGIFGLVEVIKTGTSYFLAKFQRTRKIAAKIKNNTLPKGAILKLGMLGFFSGLATLLNPYGWRVYVEIFTTIFDAYAKANINEWMPVAYSNPMSFQFLFYLALLLILLLFSLRRLDWTYTVIAGVFLALAFSSWRHMPIFLIVSTPFWATIVETLSGAEFLKLLRKKWAFALLLGALLLIGRQQWERAWTFREVEKIAQGSYPLGAVRHLQTHPIAGKMFNEYNWGGFLIWQYPEKKVYIDGRMPSWRQNDFSIFEEFNTTVKYEAGWEKTLEKYPISFALVYANPVSQVMFLNLGWEEVYRDDLAAIYKRK